MAKRWNDEDASRTKMLATQPSFPCQTSLQIDWFKLRKNMYRRELITIFVLFQLKSAVFTLESSKLDKFVDFYWFLLSFLNQANHVVDHWLVVWIQPIGVNGWVRSTIVDRVAKPVWRLQHLPTRTIRIKSNRHRLGSVSSIRRKSSNKHRKQVSSMIWTSISHHRRRRQQQLNECPSSKRSIPFSVHYLLVEVNQTMRVHFTKSSLDTQGNHWSNQVLRCQQPRRRRQLRNPSKRKYSQDHCFSPMRSVSNTCLVAPSPIQ